MTAWVRQARLAAAAKPDAWAFLMDRHDWLGERMSELGGADANLHLRGLTAFDLGEAQIALLQPLTDVAATGP